MKSTNGNVNLFDRTAESFAHGTDTKITQGSYVRGDLFTSMAVRYVKSGGRVLDYGCGPGRISIALGAKGFDVTGVDTSPGMVRVADMAVTGIPRVRFQLIQDVPELFQRNSWDGIVCSSVIEYIEDPLATLGAFYAALRSGGALIISYANARTLWRLYTLRHRRRHPHLNFQHNVWTWSRAKEALCSAGFEILTGPRFFESPFDKYPVGPMLSRSSFVGTLGLVVLRKAS